LRDAFGYFGGVPEALFNNASTVILEREAYGGGCIAGAHGWWRLLMSMAPANLDGIGPSDS